MNENNTGHGFIRDRNAAGQTYAKCTCGWETQHAYTGDSRFVDAATGRDWDVHVLGVAVSTDSGTLTRVTRQM